MEKQVFTAFNVAREVKRELPGDSFDDLSRNELMVGIGKQVKQELDVTEHINYYTNEITLTTDIVVMDKERYYQLLKKEEELMKFKAINFTDLI